MQKISKSDLKKKLRKTFRDDFKIQWSDALLDEILFEAQREYSLYSGSLIGKYKVITSDSDVQDLPDDFFQAVKVTSPEGRDIPVVSFKTLTEMYGDFRKYKGDAPEAFCFNFDSFGKFRIYPKLPKGTFAGTVVYKRLPVHDYDEQINGNAVELYALFQMYQFTGKSNAKNCFDSFINEINREKNRELGAGRKNIARTGVYF